MPFPPFSTGDPATVDVGDGTDFRIRFTADDDSCRWNDFPVTISCVEFEAASPTDPAVAYQIASFVTPLPSGGSPDPTTEWPYVWLYDPLFGLLQGYTFEIRLRFTTDARGQPRVANPISGVVWSSAVDAFPGDFDSGWVAATTADCAQVGCSNLAINFGTVFAPFSPFIPMTITNGILEVRWAAGAGTPPECQPCEAFQLAFAPPCVPDASGDIYGFPGDNAQPPSAEWTDSIIVGDQGLRNTAVDGAGSGTGSGHGTGWWNDSQFLADQDVFAHMSTVVTGTDGFWIYGRLQNPSTAGVDGYALKIVSSGAMTLYRIDNGVLTSIGTGSAGHALINYAAGVVGEGIAMRLVGDTIECLQFDPAVPGGAGDLSECGPAREDLISGLGFQSIFTVIDGTYRARQSNIGLGVDGSTARLQIFGGGNYAPNHPGLYVCLELDSCTAVQTSWNEIATAVNASSFGISATVLHGGTDNAVPTSGIMDGAECSGAVDN